MAEGGREGNMQVGDGGISNTVEVRGFLKKTSQELMEMYFENSRRSGGGDVEEVRISDEVAYITFKEAEVAQKVASRSNHQVDGHTLTVTLFHPLPPKPCYQNRVLIQGVHNAITEELLRNFMETKTKAEVTEFLYGEEDGNVVVTLSYNIDIVQLGKIFQESSIQGVFLKAARVAISNCILVQNLHPSTSHDVILYYFENKRRSGGGDVERVEMKTEERYCLIYFEDPSVIDRVLGRQSHNVDGVDFEIHLHHECLGRRSSRKKSDLYLRMSSPGNKDNATLEDENTDNQANDKTSSSVSSNPERESDFVEDKTSSSVSSNPEKESDFVEDKTSSSVSRNPEKESDFVEVQEWQANDGNNCTLSLCIKYKRAPDKKIIKCMKNIPCSWNFHLYWSFYTKTEPGKQMLHEIINNYNCSVAVFAEDEDFFLFEITENIFEQESDVVQLIEVVLDSVHKCAQQFLYLDNILVDQRIQGDVLQAVRQRKELDIARFELMGQQDFDVLCVICTEKDETLVHHAVTEIIHVVKECFENHEEIIDVDHKWQKVMKTFGYLQKLCEKYPNVTITDKTEAAIMIKGPRDQSKPAADHFVELLGTASSEVQEEIFSPGCQFEIFTYPEMCGYIDNIAREHSIVWIPNQKTKKIHLFSKMSEKKKGVDKFIRGCVQERLYPLAKDQTVFSTKMFRSLEELKKMHTGKMVFSSSHKGLLLTATDDIFESIDDAVQEIICKETENECGIARRDVEKKVSTAEENREEKYLETMTERGGTERNKEQLSQEDTEKEVQSHDTHKENVQKLVPTKNSDTLDSPIIMSVQNDMSDEESRKEKEVEFPNSKAEGGAARPLEHNACFGCQVSKATELFGNEQQSVGNEDKKKVNASDSDTMNGTSTEGKRQRHHETKNADTVTKAAASGSQGNFDTDADSKSPEDDVSEESASENDDDDDGDLMKFIVIIRDGKKNYVIPAPEGENALKWRFLFDCPHTQKELNEDPVMVGIKFECIKGCLPVLEVKKRIRALTNVKTVLQTHAEQIQIYHTIIPDAAVKKFFGVLKACERFHAKMIIAYKQKTDLYICGKKEHMEEAIQNLKHAKEYVLKLISKKEKIPVKDAPLQLVKRLMELQMSADIQYEFREDQNCLHITGLESEIIKEREKLNNLLGCITQSKYIPKMYEQFSIFEELEVVKYIEGILQEQKLVCTWKTCKEDCSIVVTAFDKETCEKACKVIDAAYVTETVHLQIDATTMICLGDSWEQELSSIYTKYGGKMKIWLNKAQDNLEYVCTLDISEMAKHEVQSLISTWDRKKHMSVEKEVIEPFIEDEHKLRKLEKKCKVDIRISKIDQVGFLIIGKDSNIQLALEELAKECSMILKPKSKPAASYPYPSSADCELFCVPGSNEVALIILKDRCNCHCNKSSQVKLKDTDTEIVEIIPLFPINASQPDEVKANVVLPADKSQRPVTFFCPKWNGGALKEKEILDSALCHLFNFLSSLGGMALLEIKDERIGNWYVGKFVKWLLVTFQKHLKTKPENTTMSRLLLLMKDKKVYDIVKATVADVYEVDAWAKSGNLSHSEDKRESPTEEEPTGIFNISKTSSNIKAIQIFLVKDLMTKRKEDVLVNSVDKSLNLSHGKVSQSILVAAGEKIQTECRNNYPKGIKAGQVAVTKAYKLQDSKFVFHGAFETWNSKNEEELKKTLKEFVTGCLQRADERKMKSIAFPAIGTGNLGYPHKVVADCMFEAVEKYSQTIQPTNIEGVYFVIFHQDKDTFNAFNERQKIREKKQIGSSVDAVLLPSYPPTSQGAKPKTITTPLYPSLSGQHQPPMCLYESVSPVADEEEDGFVSLLQWQTVENISQVKYQIFRHFFSDMLMSFLQEEIELIFSVTEKVVYVRGKDKEAVDKATEDIRRAFDEINKFHESDLSIKKEQFEYAKQLMVEMNSSFPERKVYCYIHDGDPFTIHVTARKLEEVENANRKMDIQLETFVPICQKKTLDSTPLDKSDTERSASVSSESLHPGDTTKSFKTAEGIKVFVYKGSILQAKVDVIVNAANEDLKHETGVSRVIADAAGWQLINECKSYIKNNGLLSVGTSCVTSGGRLKFPFVIHAVGPRWDKYSNTLEGLKKYEDDLLKTLFSCIFVAEKLKVQSIALPAISSGNRSGVPMEICALQYRQAVLQYSKSVKDISKIKEIHFIDVNDVILDLVTLSFSAALEDNKAASEQFGKRLKKVFSTFEQPSSQQLPVSNKFGLFSKQKKEGGPKSEKVASHYIMDKKKTKFNFSEILTVLIYIGDITESKCKAIVSSEDQIFKSQGEVAKAIKLKAGQKFDACVANYRGQLRKVGDVIQADAGNLKCEKVICCVVPMWNIRMSDEEYRKQLEQCFKCIIERSKTFLSVAIPLIGTGLKDASIEICGNVLLESLLRFSGEHRSKETIREVHIINPNDESIACVRSIFMDYFDKQKKLDAGSRQPGYIQRGSATSSERQNPPPPKSGITEDMASFNLGPNQPPGAKKMDRCKNNKQDICVICICPLKNPVKLKRCNHVFCKDCVDNQMQHKPVCSICNTIYGIITGDQPYGRMTEYIDRRHFVEGYEECGTIVITYDIPDGFETDAHHKRLKPYKGLKRTAYLPNNDKGRKVLKLLQLAFDRWLIFTIGQSQTSGKDYVVTWNGILHKTRADGGPDRYGYPDPTYLDRVLEQLAAKGVTEDSISKDQRTSSAYDSVVSESTV